MYRVFNLKVDHLRHRQQGLIFYIFVSKLVSIDLRSLNLINLCQILEFQLKSCFLQTSFFCLKSQNLEQLGKQAWFIFVPNHSLSRIGLENHKISNKYFFNNLANIFKTNSSLKVQNLEKIFVPKRLKLENKFYSIAFEVHFLKIFHKKVKDCKNPLFPQKS